MGEIANWPFEVQIWKELARWEKKVPSEPKYVDQILPELLAFLMQGSEFEDEFALDVSLREVLVNAMLHGNKGDSKRQVAIEAARCQEGFQVRIQDEGIGFDWRKRVCAQPPPVDATSGRGISLVCLFGLQLTYNSSGNQTLLRWSRDQGPLCSKET